jgi:hypothetical protein
MTLQTTHDHDEAWKGFRYVGRIHKDGMVYLKREPVRFQFSTPSRGFSYYHTHITIPPIEKRIGRLLGNLDIHGKAEIWEEGVSWELEGS